MWSAMCASCAPRVSTTAERGAKADGAADADRLRCVGVAQARACGCAPAAACATRLAHLSGAYTELAQGCRDKADLVRLKKGLTARNTEIVPITPAISTRAAELIDALAQSQGLRLADALIGATAIDLQAT